jgi:hypothetical protein
MTLVFVSAAVFRADAAFGQPPAKGPRPAPKGPRPERPPPIRPGGAAKLLSFESVRQEVKLTKDQRDKVREGLGEIAKLQREVQEKLSQVPLQDLNAKTVELHKPLAAVGDKLLNDVLSAEQRKRLREIEYQMDGIWTFAKDEIREHLKLTPDQRDKVAALRQEYSREFGTLIRSNGANPTDLRPKRNALNRDYLKKAIELLSDEQKKLWKSLTGEPFQLQDE